MTVADTSTGFVRQPSRARRSAVSIGSVAAILALWAVTAEIAQSRLLPSPLSVAQYIFAELTEGDMLFHLGMTLWRVVAAFFIAMAIGAAIGLAMGQSALVNRVLDPWLIFLLNIPALVVIILAYIWFGLNEIAAIGAVAVNKIPNVVVTIREGARTFDTGLDEMARAYRLSWWEKLRHVTLPQLQPYFAAATRSGIALIWKIVLVVELLGRPNGVGFELHLNFQLFDVTGILGYTMAFIVVMLAVELFVVQPLERHTTRWRNKPA